MTRQISCRNTSMSDRLAELRRQRELMQQHLAWLDREIAAEAAKQYPAETSAKIAAIVTASVPKSPVATPITPPARESIAPPAGVAASISAAPDADLILEEYRTPPATLHHDVRKGCFLYFAAALVLLVVVVAILYVTLTRR